nr:uncharacterized protein LOC111419355 [Onthophagus taurus]
MNNPIVDPPSVTDGGSQPSEQMFGSPIQLSPPDKINENSHNNDNNRYCCMDLPPYVVYVESLDKSIGNLHDMQVGKKLFESGLRGILRVDKRGRNRIEAEFNNYNNANEFLSCFLVKKENWRAFIPSHRVTCKGIIRGVDTSLSEETILKLIKTENRREVLHIRRLKRKTTNEQGEIIFVTTGTIVATFAGTTLPRHVSIWYSHRIPEVYISPVIQCFNCLRYGHTKTLCKSQKRCSRCSDHHDLHMCQSDIIKCIHCGQPHLSTEAGTPLANRVCPEYLRQKKIKEIMATHNYSAYEANLLIKNPEQVQLEKNIRNIYHTDFPPLKKDDVIQRTINFAASTAPRRQVVDYSDIVKKQTQQKITGTTPKNSTMTSPTMGYKSQESSKRKFPASPEEKTHNKIKNPHKKPPGNMSTRGVAFTKEIRTPLTFTKESQDPISESEGEETFTNLNNLVMQDRRRQRVFLEEEIPIDEDITLEFEGSCQE